MCTPGPFMDEPRSVSESPPAKLLDEAEWQAWLSRGRARDRRNSAARAKTLKWVFIAALLAAAALWSQLTPYEAFVRFTASTGAIVVMFQAFAAQRYASAAVFGTFALTCNPVVSLFALTGDWQRDLVAMSAVPYAASLSLLNRKECPQ